ncbi:MAG: hypothetical protein ACMZI0_11835 [Symbiopectobacterium sp.]|uniref:hypothetical protein n=1 Tax=Symbiopectobacterium sp. TaxID=2952789 RepID=UPI0039EBCC60
MLFGNVENYHYKNLESIEKEHERAVIFDILVQVFDKTRTTLSSAIYLIDSNKSELNDYVLSKLGISDAKALNYFGDVLFDKLKK